MIRKDQSRKPKGTTRFESKVFPEVWQVKEKISPHTFKLCNADDDTILHPFTQSAEHLIKVEIPGLDFDLRAKRVIEVFDDRTGIWQRYRIDKVSVDGRCLLKKLTRSPGSGPFLTRYEEETFSEWRDLTREVYRWVS